MNMTLFEGVTEPDSKNVVLEFRSDPLRTMPIACLWSRWRTPGEKDLLSFAIITDGPPPETSEAGHDRCPITIKPEHINVSLRPSPSALDTFSRYWMTKRRFTTTVVCQRRFS